MDSEPKSKPTNQELPIRILLLSVSTQQLPSMSQHQYLMLQSIHLQFIMHQFIMRQFITLALIMPHLMLSHIGYPNIPTIELNFKALQDSRNSSPHKMTDSSDVKVSRSTWFT
ncbi:hypothetical protein X975_20885, partial [Stegodyphus mimosarum]